MAYTSELFGFPDSSVPIRVMVGPVQFAPLRRMRTATTSVVSVTVKDWPRAKAVLSVSA